MSQVRSLCRWTFLFVVGVALGAWADPPKPRVMVILDTSRSMKELPRFTVPTDADVTIPVDPAMGGDYDPGLDNNCTSKFCTAKKVINGVIPKYTEDARIGLTTYYQYVLDSLKNDTQQTTCFYDVLLPAGLTYTYTSPVDFTGSGSTICSTPPCSPATQAFTFPDSTAGGMGGLQGRCVPPTGYVSVVDPSLPGATCAPGATECYQVTKVGVSPALPIQCNVATWPVPSLPVALGPPQCAVNTTYSVAAGTTVVGGVTPLRQYVSLGTPSCTGTPVAPSVTPAGAPSLSLTATPAAGAGSTIGTTYLNGNSLTCSPGAPCSLFLLSNTPQILNTNRHWFGLFDNTFTPNPAYTGGLSYSLSAQTGAAGYVASILTGVVNVASPALCPVAGRRTTGSLADYNIVNPLTALNSSAVAPPGLSTHETPTYTAGTFACTPDWPCDVVAGTPTVVPGAWVFTSYVYATSPLAPNQRINGSVPDTVSMRATTPAVVTCPAASTLASDGTVPPNFTWITSPAGCTGTGLGACTFPAGPTQTTATAPTGTCTSPVTISSSATTPPTVCSWNGKAYTAGASSSVAVTRTLPSGSMCPTAPGTIASAASGTSPGTADDYVGCPSFPCTLTGGAPLQTTSALTETTTTYDSTPPAGYTGPSVELSIGGLTYGATSAASSGVSCGSDPQPQTGTLCGSAGSPCYVRSLGYRQVSADGCGSENEPCYACVYQPVRYQWSRPKVQCNYSATTTTYTVDRTTVRCDYTRSRYRLETQQPDTYNCPYSVGARRYDFSQPSQKWCEFWALRTTLESPRSTYTYQYTTKGTEIAGRAQRVTTGATLCSETYFSSALQAQCPAVMPGCIGLTGLTSGLTAGLPVGASCKLQWGGGTSTTQAGATNGRYSRFVGSSVNLVSSSTTLAGACEENATAPADPDTYKSRAGSPLGFCSASGSPSSLTRYLVSDWYDPSITNALSSYDVVFPPSSFTNTWNNATTKSQGFGALVQMAAIPSGALPNRSIFVPIPGESAYDPTAQRDLIRAATSKCVMPNDSPPDAEGRLAGGACVSDMENPSAPGTAGVTCNSSNKCSNNAFRSCTKNNDCWPWQDFTPLYGSLKSTHAYLLDRWTNDETSPECRDYYIVLATDGAEKTPSGYAVNGNDPATSVEGLVASFRETSGASPRPRPDVKTFVIAFGENIGSLDAVAAAGGTNQAFTATSLTELETALEAVFTTITQGTYSRSRPALSTDGSRLYAAQYIRNPNTPDWAGLLTSYKLATDGTFSPAWEHGAKLNDASHPARQMRVGLKRKLDGVRVVGDFSTSNSELVDQLDDWYDYPSGLAQADVISFLRNAGEDYLTPPPPPPLPQPTRTSALGPIVISAPVVVAKSPYDSAWGGVTTDLVTAYSQFIDNVAATRPTRVLFQANDGMLHSVVEGSTDPDCASLGESALTCPNGREAWTFIPGSLERGYQSSYGRPTVVESLHKLKEGQWSEYLLDNTLSVSDVCGVGADKAAEDCLSQSDWKTIAVGTQRQGGRGIYALDVTNNAVPGSTNFLWDYWDGDLGFTYSVPAIGRVRNDGHDVFVAVFGGGIDDPGTSDIEGHHMYVLRAMDGQVIRKFNKFDRGSSEFDVTDQAIARPAMWRRPSKSYIDSAYIGIGSSLFTMRFAKTPTSGGDQYGNDDKWKPEEFFDPTSARNYRRVTYDIPVRQVVETVNPFPTPPSYTLTTVRNLPLPTAPPILNRPKMGALLVTSGAVPDLYVGTGDVQDPANPAPEYQFGNYFYAVHDNNEQRKGSENDGVPLWTIKFPGKEQVVSEPAIISGCIIVATYTPPLTSTSCGASGNTTLYGFSPLTGDLTPCLTYPPGSPYSGTSTPVVKLPGAGIPSDLIVVNDNVYLATETGGLQRAPVRQLPKAGNVRSYRRLK